jgi:hypothetical protein
VTTNYVVNCDLFAIVLEFLLFVVLWRLAELIFLCYVSYKLCNFLAILHVDQFRSPWQRYVLIDVCSEIY